MTRPQQQPAFYGILLEDFVGAKFYCLHALVEGNKCIRIR